MQKNSVCLWINSSWEQFKAYLMASFQTSKLSLRHQATSFFISWHVLSSAFHSHWLKRLFWIWVWFGSFPTVSPQALVHYPNHSRVHHDIVLIWKIFTVNSNFGSLRAYHLFIVHTIKSPCFLIYWYSTYNYLEKNEFKFIVVRQSLNYVYVVRMCLRLMRPPLRHDWK